MINFVNFHQRSLLALIGKFQNLSERDEALICLALLLTFVAMTKVRKNQFT